MKVALTINLTWYPLEPHVGQRGWKRCLLRNEGEDIITITQRGAAEVAPTPGVVGEPTAYQGFPLLPGEVLILPTQEKLWASSDLNGQVLTYEYIA